MRRSTQQAVLTGLGRFLGTPFGLAVLGCLVLAGWALWSGGILDGPIARHVRTSAVYAAPGIDLDHTAAERIVGNRRLVVVMLEPGADLRAGCDSVRHAAAGTVVLLLSRSDDEYETYACALIPDRDDENFGRAAVAETIIDSGIDEFVDRPLDALKVVTINYDLLVRTGTIPDGTRTISPSLPRYLVAAAAVVAVIAGSTVLYGAGWRAGRLTTVRRSRRDARADSRSTLSAATAVLAQQIIDLDQRYTRAERRGTTGTRQVRDEQRTFDREYRQLASDYTELLDAVTAAAGQEGADLDGLTSRVESLSTRSRRLAESVGP